MVGIGETYGEPVSSARMEIYFRALEDFPIAAIRLAATAHVKHAKFFPRPAELREAIAGSVDDRAEAAWTTVTSLVRRYGYTGIDGKGKAPAFPDEATRRAALELYGGWGNLCANLPATGPELLGTAKLFKASFSAYARRDQVQPLLPPSRDEARQCLHDVKVALVERGLPTGNL